MVVYRFGQGVIVANGPTRQGIFGCRLDHSHWRLGLRSAVLEHAFAIGDQQRGAARPHDVVTALSVNTQGLVHGIGGIGQRSGHACTGHTIAIDVNAFADFFSAYLFQPTIPRGGHPSDGVVGIGVHGQGQFVNLPPICGFLGRGGS